jgi:hypothetical protein
MTMTKRVLVVVLSPQCWHGPLAHRTHSPTPAPAPGQHQHQHQLRLGASLPPPAPCRSLVCLHHSFGLDSIRVGAGYSSIIGHVRAASLLEAAEAHARLLPSNLHAHHNRLKHHGPRHCDMPHVQHPSLPLAIHQLHPLVTCSWLATTTRLTLCNMLQLMLKL